MIRKLFASVLAMLMLSTVVSAHELSTSKENDLYIQSRECPSDIIRYAEENIADFVMSMDETSEIDYSRIIVGQPFSYGDTAPNLYTFPIYQGDDIVFTLRVAYTPDGGIDGTISTFLVEELNSFTGKTTPSTPLCLNIIDNKLVANIGNKSATVFEFSADESMPVFTCANEVPLVTLNVAKDLGCNLSGQSTRNNSMYYIALSVTEVQPEGNRWCSAYVTAAILRTQIGGGFTAQQIMRYYYGSSVSSSQTLSANLAVAYMREVGGLTAATYSSSKLSDSQLKTQISNEYPVYISMKNLSSSEGGYHAVALRGYSDNLGKWSIWNPVNSNMACETYSYGGNYVSTTGNVFSYDADGRTIYNCH